MDSKTRSWLHGRKLTGLAVLILGFAAACSGDAKNTNLSKVDSAAVPATTPPDPVPPAVAAIGHHAENAYDAAKTGNWTYGKATVDSLRTAAGQLPDSSSAELAHLKPLRDTMGITLGALERAMNSRDSIQAMHSANKLTELGARLSDPYGPRTPVGVTLLDYYGRELELWGGTRANTSDEKLKAVSAAIRRTWDATRPQLLAKGGAVEAARFDSLVTKVGIAKTRAEYVTLSTSVLDQVDNLEKVFTR